MSKSGAMDLASNLGGKIDKSDVLTAVEKYVCFLSIVNVVSFSDSIKQHSFCLPCILILVDPLYRYENLFLSNFLFVCVFFCQLMENNALNILWK